MLVWAQNRTSHESSCVASAPVVSVHGDCPGDGSSPSPDQFEAWSCTALMSEQCGHGNLQRVKCLLGCEHRVVTDLDTPRLSWVVHKNLAVQVYITILGYKNIKSKVLIDVEVGVTVHNSDLASISFHLKHSPSLPCTSSASKLANPLCKEPVTAPVCHSSHSWPARIWWLQATEATYLYYSV